MKKLPHWRIDTIYKHLEAEEYFTDIKRLKEQIELLEKIVEKAPAELPSKLEWMVQYITIYNSVYDLFDTLYAFVYTYYSTNTSNYLALRKINELEKIRLPLNRIEVVFRNKISSIDIPLSEWVKQKTELKEYYFFLEEQLYLSGKQMSSQQEELAMDLSRAGAFAWQRLQEAISSTLNVLWDEKTGKQKTVIQLRLLQHHHNRRTRKKAFLKELEAWESMKIPLSFAINGVKGFSVILNKRRNYSNTLERSVFQSRISKQVLAALIETLEMALPHFRRYLIIKAKFLGLKKLAFFDLFAPIDSAQKKWDFELAKNFIISQFDTFSQELADFTKELFINSWIDAEPRTGKVGGAYCISFPLNKESRILCNFDGSFSAVTTLAHEIGHAYHHHVLRQDNYIHRDYPMTLAETASIFSENLVINGALSSFKEQDKKYALELFLSDATQVIVDILSRYMFESKLLEQREEKELSPEELNLLMLDAQKQTYGNALDHEYLHPYMWAVKSHYYRSELAFYNYPYAFGLLFGLGLFELFKKQGKKFINTYKQVLENSGRMSAVTLTKKLGFDIETKDFWNAGMDLIIARIDEYEKLVDNI